MKPNTPSHLVLRLRLHGSLLPYSLICLSVMFLGHSISPSLTYLNVLIVNVCVKSWNPFDMACMRMDSTHRVAMETECRVWS